MPQLSSKYFGTLECDPDAVFRFPDGVPGFEDQTEFVFLEQPHTDPLIFMQSMIDPGLCFLAAPVFVADPDYRLTLIPEDREALGLSPSEPAVIGEQVLCLALVTVHEGSGPTANLASPIVLGLRSRIGIQSFQYSSEEMLRKPLISAEEPVPCL